jgi:hypothetical protein
MPNLLNFIRQQGTLLTNHHTPLISHTSVDILTALTGLYGDRMGVSVGNSFRYFNPDGTTNGASSFAYWTDPLAAFGGPPITDTTPQMIGKDGKIAPAPWAAFTRAGCDVGAFSVANIEFENIGLTSPLSSARTRQKAPRRQPIRLRRRLIFSASPCTARKAASYAQPARRTF